jgi:hypothetical protein
MEWTHLFLLKVHLRSRACVPKIYGRSQDRVPGLGVDSGHCKRLLFGIDLESNRFASDDFESNCQYHAAPSHFRFLRLDP